MAHYDLIKTLHILSAAILFGTGLGIAAMMLAGRLSGDVAAARFAARTTVRFDMMFTLPAVIVQPLTRRFTIIARSGHGPFIPCAPAIILARQLAGGTLRRTGAMPCLDLIDLPTYQAALVGLDIRMFRDEGGGSDARPAASRMSGGF